MSQNKENKRYSSVEEVWKSFERFEKEHPLLHNIQSLYYAIRRFFIRIIDFFKYDIKYFIQRGKRGWSDRDTWGFHYYLAKVIYEGLIHLKKYKHGYPITILPKKVKDPNKDIDYKANEKVWDKIMDKMICSFKLAKEIGEGEREFYLPKMSKEFKKKYKCLAKIEDRKIKEGFRLFTEHFFDLWD